MKKLLCILLTILMAASVLASCNKDSGDEAMTDGDSQTASNTEDSGTINEAPGAESAPETIDLIVNGASKYYLVCTDYNTYSEAVQYVSDDIARRTGITLEVALAKVEDSSQHMIFVGGDYASLFPNAETKMTYSGYAAVYHEGDIYLCGNNSDTVKKAATKFMSSISTKECITRDENGRVSLAIPKTLMFVYNPGYPIMKPTLLSAHISDYRLVLSKDAGYADTLLAEQLVDQLGALTGFIPKIVTDAEAATEREIVLGSTNRKAVAELADRYSYAVVSEGSKLYVTWGSTKAFDGIFQNIKGVFGKETVSLSGKIDQDCKIEKSADEIRVMTSNVLFWNADNAQLPYGQRAALLSDLYLDFKPDFIGLQEAQYGIGDEIRDAVASEYTMISQSKNRQTPILYRHGTWKISEDNGVQIKKVQMFANNWCWEYEWVMFERINDSTEKVIVMNLHFHPDVSPYRDPRADDIDAFNAEVRRLEGLYPNVPMFVTGDYNTTVNHVRGDLDDGWTEDIIVGTKLQCGALLTEDNNDPNGKAIDHICTNGDLVDVVRHRSVSYKAMEKSSDHIPYFIDVKLKNS